MGLSSVFWASLLTFHVLSTWKMPVCVSQRRWSSEQTWTFGNWIGKWLTSVLCVNRTHLRLAMGFYFTREAFLYQWARQFPSPGYILEVVGIQGCTVSADIRKCELLSPTCGGNVGEPGVPIQGRVRITSPILFSFVIPWFWSKRTSWWVSSRRLNRFLPIC